MIEKNYNSHIGAVAFLGNGGDKMPKCEFDFVRFVEEWSRRLRRADRFLPIFEAASNGIHAIQEYGDGRLGTVDVELLRDGWDVLDGFQISDDGVGFTDANLESFQRVFSNRKKKIGGKGVGRVAWLACFERVEIESVFRQEDGAIGKRRIVFSLQNDDPVSVESLPCAKEETPCSVVTLRGIRKAFNQLAQKTAEETALALYKHFFLEITRGVKIQVKERGRVVDLSDFGKRVSNQEARVKSETFAVTTAQMKASGKNDKHQAYYCANGRVVEEIDFEALCGVPSKTAFVDDDGAYFVNAYVQSDYFDQNVDPDRTTIYFPDGLLNDGTAPTKEEVDAAIAGSLRNSYRREIDAAESEKKRAVENFVAANPQYRSLYKHAAPELDTLKWNASEKDIGLAFYNARARLEATQRQTWETFKKLDPEEISPEELSKKFRDCLELVESSKQADLAAYVLKRKMVIEILEYLLKRRNDDHYHAERRVHDLIYPMGKTSQDAESWGNNIWLIDDKLIPYEFIASDKRLESLPFIDSRDKERPDLVAFDNPMAFALDVESQTINNLVVVEFKKPARDDYDDAKNPIDQVIDYVEKLKEGYAKTAKGRPITISDGAQIYCYLIADLTKSLDKICKRKLRKTQGGGGYYGTNEDPFVYIEVVSFDKLLFDAKKRNASFFERLGLSQRVFID